MVAFTHINDESSTKLNQGDIIVFLGTVATGKSTQIKLLRHHLKGRGIKCVYLYVGAFDGVAHLYRCFLRYLTCKCIRFEQDDSWSSFRLRTLLLMDILSMMTYDLLRIVLLSKIFKYVLIVEDYFLTRLMDYLYNTSYWYLKKYKSTKLNFNNDFITRVAILVCMKLNCIFTPKIVYLLDAEDRELAGRLNKRNSNESFDYIRFRRRTLDLLSGIIKNRVYHINTSVERIGDTHKRILKTFSY